jgi:hypothetical protein
MKTLLVLACLGLGACSFITLQDGPVKVTRLAVGTSLQVKSLSVGTNAVGQRTVTVEGVGSEQVDSFKAVAQGVAEALKPRIVP